MRPDRLQCQLNRCKTCKPWPKRPQALRIFILSALLIISDHKQLCILSKNQYSFGKATYMQPKNTPGSNDYISYSKTVRDFKNTRASWYLELLALIALEGPLGLSSFLSSLPSPLLSSRLVSSLLI